MLKMKQGDNNINYCTSTGEGRSGNSLHWLDDSNVEEEIFINPNDWLEDRTLSRKWLMELDASDIFVK